MWLERADQSFVGNIAVWYDLKLKDNEGTKWLKDMRQWWRRSGRELTMPVDGLSSATRPPGEHQLRIAHDKAPFAKLADGEYQIVVEAAREVGGRELAAHSFPVAAQGGSGSQSPRSTRARRGRARSQALKSTETEHAKVA